jgi:hypothetical protein
MNKARINLWASIFTIIGTVVTSAIFLLSLLKPPSGIPNSLDLSGLPRVQAILFIGLAAAAAHGLLWSLAESIFGWHFKAGGASLPQGGSAVVLSATMTVPLLYLPPLYARITHTRLVPARHLLAACLVVVFAAIGHIIIYGVKVGALHFSGIRNFVFPWPLRRNWKRALLMEFLYAATHFSSIVLTYRIVVGSLRPLGAAILYAILIPAVVWLSCDYVGIFLNYPGSLTQKRFIEVRGLSTPWC